MMDSVKNITKINKEELDNNILNLKIISKIQENDKLITNDELIKIDSPNFLQGISRWYNNNSRAITLKKLNEIIEISFKFTDVIINNEVIQYENNLYSLEDNNSELFQKFIVELTNSLNGLNNLKNTYSNDILIASQIDLIINKINNRLEKMTKIFKIKVK